MNFTTLIILIFTAILAIGSVSKRLKPIHNIAIHTIVIEGLCFLWFLLLLNVSSTLKIKGTHFKINLYELWLLQVGGRAFEWTWISVEEATFTWN